MKLYINRQFRNSPYGGGNQFVLNWFKFFEMQEKAGNKNHELCMPNDPQASPDVMLIVGLDNDGTGVSVDQALMYKMTLNPNVKIVVRINENDARKGTSDVDDKLIKLSGMIDGTIFVSKWLHDYFMKLGWKCRTNTIIHNGVDVEIFKSAAKLNNGKVNILAHHWSNNFLKGFDIYDKLDEFVKYNKEFTFTYIGRERGTFKNTTVLQPLHGKKLGEELAKYDVYISASRFDPGPNHVLESLSCELPTYVHKDGGGCIEFAGSDHVYKSWDELEALLLSKKFVQNTQFKLPTWNSCMESCVKFLENV